MKSLDSKIEEILADAMEHYNDPPKDYVSQLKLLLIETILEVVGEDEKLRLAGMIINQDILERNKLRAEIRERIKGL